MPKIVDHRERRSVIVAACWRVIARQGLAGTTTREIAREAGVSHGIVSHYFPDKNAVLAEALHASYEELKQRITRRTAGLSGARALRAVILHALPGNARERLAEQVELAFWGQAVGDPAMAAARWRTYLEWRAALRALVVDAQAQGELSAAADPDVVADVLVALVDGLGAQAALYPDRFPARRLSPMVDEVLRGFGVDADDAATPPERRPHAPQDDSRPAHAPDRR